MTVALTRTQSGVEGTFGVLRAGEFVCVTAEPPWRDNARRRSCIPPGVYRCEFKPSAKFLKAYELIDVPDRSNVLIHVGNVAGDVEVGLDSDSQGCILLGYRFGRLLRNGHMQRAVLVSRPAVRDFVGVMGQAPFDLVVQ